MTDEQIRLILDLGGSTVSVKEVTAALEQLRGKATDVGDTYQVMMGELGTYEVSARRAAQTTSQQYTPALDNAVEAAVEATRAQKLLRESLELTSAAQQKAAGSSKEMSMRILNLGRAAQDLAQGGLGGVINNIEGIVGGGGLAAGVLTGIGTAALLATPYIKEWWKTLQGAGDKIPESKDAIEKYTEAINKNKEAIKSLKEQSELTYAELDRYKDLVDKTAKLEEEQANAREARMVKDGSSKKDRANAAAVRETIAEKYGSGQELIDSIMATENGRLTGLKGVEAMIADAMKGTGLGLGNLLRSNPEFAAKFKEFDPKTKEAAEKAKKDAAAKAKDDKLRDELTEQGKDFQRKGEEAENKAQAQGPKDQFRAFVKAGRAQHQLRGDISAEGRRRAAAKKANDAAQEQRNQVRGVQQEAAEQGLRINPQQALQILKERQSQYKELQRLEAQGMGMMLQSVGDVSEQVNMWKQFNKQAGQQNRSNGSNGFAN
jgi:hypothetical protein